MRIDAETLISSLNELKIVENMSWREIERQSGVYNISRIVSGEIKKPTAESWWMLHNAFPKHIPEPSYIDGSKVYKNVQTITGNANITAQGGTVKNATIIKGEVLSTSEKALVEALRTLGEDENNFIYSILGKIAEMQK